MEVLIDRLDHQGRGIGKIDNKTIFVYDALPNELVDVEIVFENKKIMEGKVIKYLKISPKRIEPICPYFKECGGCDLMHINYDEELKYKENKVKQIVEKFSSIDKNVIKQIVGNDNDFYRNKSTLHVNCKVGYYSKKSKNIVPIDKCYIVDEKINEILNILKQLDLKNIYEVVVRTSKYLDDSMIILKINNSINQNIIDRLKEITNNIIIYQNKKYTTLYGNGYIYDMIGEYKFKISPDSFFKINKKQEKKLYDKVLEYLEPTSNDKVLDLYCGTGTIGIYISKYVKEVKGIEINKYAVKDAFINEEINKINNINFECLDASDISKVKEKFDKIIVDPPRNGLDKKTIEYLIKSNVKRIVYVSCDPVTLTRDLELLKDYYDISEITPVDMFSRTYHVENVTLLKKKEEI